MNNEALLVLSALVLWLVVVANYSLRPDALHPAYLQSGLWALVLTGYLFRQGDLPSVSASTLMLILSGALAFSVGAHAVSLSAPSRRERRESPPTFPLRLFGLTCLLVTFIGLPLFLLRARELGMAGPTDNALLNIRYAITVEGERFGLLAYLFPVAVLSVGIHVLFSKCYSNFRTAAVLAIALVYATLFTGRTFLFLIMIYAIGILVAMGKISLSKASAILLSLGLTAFVALGVLLHKGGTPDASLQENLVSMAQSFQSYLLGPLAALDWLMRQDLPAAFGDNTLRSVYAIFAAVDNEQTKVVPLVRDVINVGVEANVYTVYDPYLRDFGIVGALVFAGMLGSLHGYLFRMTRLSDNPVWVLAYALSLYPLLMQFFQDQYFSLLSSWWQYAVLLAALGFLAIRTDKTTWAQ